MDTEYYPRRANTRSERRTEGSSEVAPHDLQKRLGLAARIVQGDVMDRAVRCLRQLGRTAAQEDRRVLQAHENFEMSAPLCGTPM